MNPEYRCAFFDLLLQHYKIYQEKGLVISGNFKKSTNDFINNCAPIRSFINDKCVITNNKKDRENVSDLYSEFIDYTGRKDIGIKKFSFRIYER